MKMTGISTDILILIGTFFIYATPAMSQEKPGKHRSLQDLQITEETIEESELKGRRDRQTSPSGRFTILKKRPGPKMISIRDAETGSVETVKIRGSARGISWSKNEEVLSYGVCGIPVPNGKTCWVGVISLKDYQFKLIDPPGYLLLNSRISADGKKILCTGSTLDVTHILLIDIETEDVEIIEERNSAQPRWVPNSDKILYTEALAGGYYQLWVYDRSTKERLPLGDAKIHLRYPRPSPDGKRVAYAGREIDESIELYVVDMDGNNLSEVASIHAEGIFYHSWSPDGRMLLYQEPVVAGHYEKTVESELILVDMNTLERRQITDSPGLIARLRGWEDSSTILISYKNKDKTTGFSRVKFK